MQTNRENIKPYMQLASVVTSLLVMKAYDGVLFAMAAILLLVVTVDFFLNKK
jgi:predicted membrane-bound dolichyl-phosphate-mannose-protein mannosyltransferase